MAVQGVLSEGCRWRIGEGKSIPVWNSHWVRSHPSSKLLAITRMGLEDMTVNQLMLPGRRAWNTMLVRLLFNQEEADSILKVPLISSVRDDWLCWETSNTGEFIVRTMYQLCRQALIPSSFILIMATEIYCGTWKSRLKSNILYGDCVGITSQLE